MKYLLSVIFALFLSNAQANEAGIKSAIQKRLPGEKVLSVTKTPYFGLYEVALENEIIYTDEKMSYIFNGSIYDFHTMQNLTEARAKKIYAVDFKALPLDLAVKNVKGNGKRKLAVFTDPNCPFCKRLENEMAGLTDTTIYLFLYPVLPGSEEKAKAVWCSNDRLKAWEELLLKNVQPKPEKACDTSALGQIGKLGQKLRINGTPGIIFEDGFMNPGYMPREQIEKQLSASTPK